MLLSLRFFCNSLSFSPSASHSPPKNQLFLLSSYSSAGDVTSGLSPMQFRKYSVGILVANTCIAILFLLIPFRLSWKNEKIQPRHYVKVSIWCSIYSTAGQCSDAYLLHGLENVLQAEKCGTQIKHNSWCEGILRVCL